jgi:hypothetical protein
LYPERNWTLSTYYAGILTNFVALVLALAAPRLFLIVQRTFEVYWVKPNDTPQGNIAHQSGTTVDGVEADRNHEPSELLPGEATDNVVAVENPTDPSPHVEPGLQNEPEPIENSFPPDSCRNVSICALDNMLIRTQLIRE